MIKIIICGKSGSGKSTLAAKLRALGLKQAKLHVLGPRREHHNDDEYIYGEPQAAFWHADVIARKKYDQWEYILYFDEVFKNDFIVLAPEMIQKYLNSSRIKIFTKIGFDYTNPMIIYLDYPRDVRLLRVEQRDGKITDEAVRRLQSDEEDFQDFKDYTIRVNSDFLYP
jgi:tRNA uridine 5-carbamoylmethylation protein Kti12